MRIYIGWKYTLILTGCLIAGACRKTVQPVTVPDSELAFFDASPYLYGELAPNGKSAYVLLDSKLAPYAYADSPGAPPIPLPSFEYNQYEFPGNGTSTADATQTWESYLHVYPGNHILTLTDTGGHFPLLLNQRIQTNTVYPTTVFYADSLGAFGSWVVSDTLVGVQGQASVRLVDLSPDAGKLFFTVNDQAAPAKAPGTLNYGTITSFIPYTGITADSMLLFSFYNPGDSVDVVTSALLQVASGHSYTLLIEGLLNGESYRDPVSGNIRQYSPNLNVLMKQNY